jgi:hypothetical protein
MLKEKPFLSSMKYITITFNIQTNVIKFCGFDLPYLAYFHYNFQTTIQYEIKILSFHQGSGFFLINYKLQHAKYATLNLP